MSQNLKSWSSVVKEALSFLLIAVCILLTGAAGSGCKPKQEVASETPPDRAQPQFRTESQFIVSSIVSDLAEQITYAASGQFPTDREPAVVVTEKRGSTIDTPTFELEVNLLTNQPPLKMEVTVDGPIWSPSVYKGVAAAMAKAAGLAAAPKTPPADTLLLSKLADGSAETIERENQRLSAALTSDFKNPELHEQAALLLGAFALREYSGRFYEIRCPLSRMTAHLALAQILRDGNAWGINGRIGEAMLLTLAKVSGPAVERLRGFDAEDAESGPMVRALLVRNTGDYRLLASREDRSPIESVALFFAEADYVASEPAWDKLSDSQKATIDFVRIANDLGYSVQMGHQLLESAGSLELDEVMNIYELSHNKELNRSNITEVLNEKPERCFSAAVDGKKTVRVIGWGQWAMFLQRHICHATQQNFRFLKSMLGVPEAANTFAAEAEEQFGGLRLFPFIRRMLCNDEKSYHRAMDDACRVINETPYLLPTECWNWLRSKPRFAELYAPVSPARVAEWHRHNPPPGTLYCLSPRLNHPSIIERPDALQFYEKLHKLAPYDCRISNLILGKKYKDDEHATYEEAVELYKEVLSYSVFAMKVVAHTVHDNPAEFEKLMLRAAELEPSSFYNLANHAINNGEDDKGSEYLERACAADPDAVRVSNHAKWRVEYFLRKGQKEKAREIADDAAEVYSETGLTSKAIFFERTGSPDDAFEWYSKIESRYNNRTPLLLFCMRHQLATGDNRFEGEVTSRLKEIFPKGMEKVTLADFTVAPIDGVLIQQENERTKDAGIHAGDVIVAVYGLRVRNTRQYDWGRAVKSTPELELILWQGNGYREVRASPPDHRFGINIGDFRKE